MEVLDSPEAPPRTLFARVPAEFLQRVFFYQDPYHRQIEDRILHGATILNLLDEIRIAEMTGDLPAQELRLNPDDPHEKIDGSFIRYQASFSQALAAEAERPVTAVTPLWFSVEEQQYQGLDGLRISRGHADMDGLMTEAGWAYCIAQQLRLPTANASAPPPF
jgi:hypothetical protein